MVPEEPKPASELVLKKVVPPPSDEALKLAAIASDTIDAFDRRFKGDLSFRHPMPGMIATDDSAVKYEAMLVSMIGTAFQERVRNYFAEEHHRIGRAEQLADEERRRKEQPDWTKLTKESMVEMMQALEDQAKGVKRIKPDEKAAGHTIAVLGLAPSDPLPSIYDPPPEGAESGSESTATTDPPPDDGSSGGSTSGS